MAFNFLKNNKSSDRRNISVKYKLKQKHINDLKVILDRDLLLKRLPSNAKVAEIGVDKGFFALKILEICKPSELILIDSWEAKRFLSGEEKVKARFSKEIKNNIVKVIKGRSIAVAKYIDDRSLDWVYIDTDHSYSTTIKELYTYASKIKQKGIIAGHDYCIGNWTNQYKYGVIEAVHEFCVKEDYKIIYLTSSNEYYRSYAIQKI